MRGPALHRADRLSAEAAQILAIEAELAALQTEFYAKQRVVLKPLQDEYDPRLALVTERLRLARETEQEKWA